MTQTPCSNSPNILPLEFNPCQSLSLAQSHNPGKGNTLSLTCYLYLIHQIVSPKQLLMGGNIMLTYADAE